MDRPKIYDFGGISQRFYFCVRSHWCDLRDRF